MKRRYLVAHPPGAPVIGSRGMSGPGLGGPIPQDPNRPQPPNPAPLPAVRLPQLPDPLAGVGDAIGKATTGLLSSGEILIGVLLILVGLLLATGLGPKAARAGAKAGVMAATRGAVR